MTAFIFKSILCSGSLLLIYYLVLEREKSYRFNRAYLLFALFFSFVVYAIKVAVPVAPVATQLYATSTLASGAMTSIPTTNEPTSLWTYLLLWTYAAITLYLLIRFIANLVRLSRKIKANPKVNWHGTQLVLVHNGALPHSFFRYIFLDRESYATGAIENEVLLHERTHVRQRHSLDILLIELLLVFVWFNPFIWLFRRAILLNHEFLADREVLETFRNPAAYQQLLLNKSRFINKILLTSPFNYLFIKKRFIMMTKQTSRRVTLLKQLAVLPLIAVVGLLFSTKVEAQAKPDSLKQKKTEINQSASQKGDARVKSTKQVLDQKQQEQRIIEKKAALDRKQQDENIVRQKEQLDRQQAEQKRELEQKIDQHQSAIDKKIDLEKRMHERALDRQKEQMERQQDLSKRKLELDRAQHERQIDLHKRQMERQNSLYEEKAARYKEQQKHYLEDQKIKMEKEHADYEQKLQRYKENQAHMTAEQKAKYEAEQRQYQEKMKAYKAQQQSLDEQKLKMDKEAKALQQKEQEARKSVEK